MTARLASLLCVTVIGCQTPTQVVVLLDAEPDALRRASHVEVRACTDFDGDVARCAMVYEEIRGLSRVPSPIPGRIPIGPPRSRDARFWLEATLRAEDPSFEVTARATGAYPPGQADEVRLVLEAACRGVTCGRLETCRGGACFDACVGSDCEPVDAGVVGPPDAGVPDVGPPDAGCRCPCAGDRCEGGACRPATAVDEVSTGRFHGCARQGGDLRCWGSNTAGQLGLGADLVGQLVDTPTPVTMEDAVQLVSAGETSTCAILEPGSLWCWGSNNNRRLGKPSGGFDNRAPSQVEPDRTWASLAVLSRHACGTTTRGQALCWGRAIDGQVGDVEPPPDPPDVSDPVVAAFLELVTVGANHSCGLTETGNLRCWGANGQGQAGQSQAEVGANVWEPTAVAGAGRFSTIDGGGNRNCGIRDSGQLRCWGDNRDRLMGVADDEPGEVETPRPVETPELFEAVSVGNLHQCAITIDGRLFCWGVNINGQLGVGDFRSRDRPTEVMPSGGWTAVSAGYSYTCALRDSGAMFCWGQAEAGQLTASCGRSDLAEPCRACVPP